MGIPTIIITITSTAIITGRATIRRRSTEIRTSFTVREGTARAEATTAAAARDPDTAGATLPTVAPAQCLRGLRLALLPNRPFLRAPAMATPPVPAVLRPVILPAAVLHPVILQEAVRRPVRTAEECAAAEGLSAGVPVHRPARIAEAREAEVPGDADSFNNSKIVSK